MSLLDYVTLQGAARTIPPAGPLPDPPAYPAYLETKAAPVGGGVTVVPTAQAGQPARSYDTDPQRAQREYLRNALVYACITARADAAQVPPLLVERRTAARDTTWETQPDHPLAALWAWPNERDDAASFQGKVSTDLDMTGLFAAQKIRASSGAIGELRRLNPALVAAIPGRDGQVAAYEYRINTVPLKIPAADLLVRWNPHPTQPFQGLAPLQVALGTVDADNGAQEYVRDFYNNAGVIAGILKVTGRIDEAQADEVRNRWLRQFARRFGGARHSVSVQDDRISYEPVGSQLKDLDNAFLRSSDEARIHMVFKVPPLITYSYIGLQRATYNNLPAAYRGFWETTMTTWFTQIASWLTRHLLPEYESEDAIRAGLIRCRFDLTQVPALQDSADGKHNRALAALGAGAWSLNETRDQTGQEPLPPAQGDLYYLPSQLRVLTPDTLATPPPAPPAPVVAPVLPTAPALPEPVPGQKALPTARDWTRAKLQAELARVLTATYADAARAAGPSTNGHKE